MTKPRVVTTTDGNHRWACCECGRTWDNNDFATMCCFTPQRPDATQVGGNHYADMSIAPWTVVDTWPLEQRLGYYRGNCLKYTMRLGNKDEELQEAGKLAHYAQKLVETLREAKG